MTAALQTIPPRMPSRPEWALPAGACDCHTHVFGPYERFPLIHPTPYAPPLAPADVHRAMLTQIGASRGVLVQPGAFGSDPSAIVAALRDAGGHLRGVAASRSEVSDSELDTWHEAGIRALRFNEMPAPSGSGRYPGSIGIDELDRLAPRLATRGWHAEVWARLDTHAALLPRLRGFGISVVLDHMAGLVASHGIAHPDFQAILHALQEGWLWVKLTLCRCSGDYPDYQELRPFHDALIAANPDRVVWGSDWPYVRLGDKTPDVAHVLSLFRDWVPNESLRHRILVTNPARLYGF